MERDNVLIEWRSNNKWHGVQQEIKRKDIDPDGPLDIGQKIRVKFGRGRHDAVVVESWNPNTRSNKTSEQESEDPEDDIPLNKLVRKESASPENVSESKCYDEYILKRNKKLITNQERTSKEKSASKEKDDDVDGKADPKEKPSPDLVDNTKQHRVSGSEEGASKRKHDDIAGEQGGKADPLQPEQPDLVKRRRVSILKDEAVPQPEKHEDITDVDNAGNAAAALQQPDDVVDAEKDDEDEDHDDLRGIWEYDMDYLPDTRQISEDVKTIKDWVEGLHRKTDLLFNLVSAIEARLAAIEAGICLVPFSLQDPRSQPPNNNIPNVQLPIQSVSPQSLTQSKAMNTSTSSSTASATSISQSLQSFQPESSTLNNTQSTPITPTHRPKPLPSISPIVSNLPKETVSKLKKCQQKVSSRKKYTRKCLEEIFSADELAASNVSGNAGKDKLDEYKVGLINRLVLAAFPLIPEVENSDDVAREIASTINLKCRELKKSKRSQQTTSDV